MFHFSRKIRWKESISAEDCLSVEIGSLQKCVAERREVFKGKVRNERMPADCKEKD